MASRKVSQLHQSLTDSWGVVDHESSDADSSSGHQPMSASESDGYTTKPRRSKRRTETPPIEDEDVTPRPPRSSRLNQRSSRPTPPRTRSIQSQEPQFIMPTPDSTPLRNPRRRVQTRATDRSDVISLATQKSGRGRITHESYLRSNRSRTITKPVVSNGWQQQVDYVWFNVVKPIVHYASSCLVDAARLIFSFAKLPITILVALLIVRQMISAAIPNWMPFSLSSIPLVKSVETLPCHIPVLSNYLPGCPVSSRSVEKSPAYDRMTSLQESWDRMLEIAQQSAPIPMQMSVAQAVIADTRNLIKHQSSLPSKAQLLFEIQTYMDLSKQATFEFTDFGSHVGRTVDKVISMNRLTLASLEMFKNRIQSSGLLSRALDAVLPNGYVTISEADVIDQYLKHAGEIEDHTDALITEGEQVAMRLQEMENTLEEIRNTANRDWAGFIERKEELFAKLWTKLGGNAKDKKFVQKNIDIADRLGKSASEAAVTVRQWLLELRSVKNDISDLRARINEPRSRMHMSAMEIEEHIKYVHDGLDRLYNKRLEGRERKESGMAGIKQYIQGYWSSQEGLDQERRKHIADGR